jgi:hypothetical protein
LHKWKNFGEKVVITWREPGILPGLKENKSKQVFTERMCLRCGIKQKRKFFDNIDGTHSAAGWETIEEAKDKFLHSTT